MEGLSRRLGGVRGEAALKRLSTVLEAGGAAAINSARHGAAISFPTGVQDDGDGVRTGTLANGGTIVVRPMSTEGSPTLEIQPASGKVIKVRYPEDRPDEPRPAAPAPKTP